jgi:hypothetical protein
MPIRQSTDQGETITESSRAMRLFTDRHDAIKHFATLLNVALAADRPTPEKVLFFHGDGGNGKSLLLRFLRERCCKRLSPEGLRALSACQAFNLEIYLRLGRELNFAASEPALTRGMRCKVWAICKPNCRNTKRQR